MLLAGYKKGGRATRLEAVGDDKVFRTVEFDVYGPKAKQVVRSGVFLNLRDEDHNQKAPAALIVFDRVVSANAAFRKCWLLHSLEEPQLSGPTAVVDCAEHGGRGRLVLTALLPRPEDLSLSKVGGPGKEFWVFDTNYANDVEPARRERSSMETGAWRIEISPVRPAAEDLFLNVMQVTDRLAPTMLPVGGIEAGPMVGCRVEKPAGGGWVVLFRRDGRRTDQPATVRVEGKGRWRFLITDLAAGAWRIRRGDSAGQPQTVQVAEEQGAAWFEGEAGTWSLEMQSKG